MIGYKDKSYCGSDVKIHTCGREFTEDEHIEFGTLMGYEEKNIKSWVEAMSNKAKL